MDPDHFINCLRVYDGTDPIQIDLLRRQSKRRTTRAGLYRDDLVFFRALRIFRMVTGLHPVEHESSSLVTFPFHRTLKEKSDSAPQWNIYC